MHVTAVVVCCAAAALQLGAIFLAAGLNLQYCLESCFYCQDVCCPQTVFVQSLALLCQPPSHLAWLWPQLSVAVHLPTCNITPVVIVMYTLYAHHLDSNDQWRQQACRHTQPQPI